MLRGEVVERRVGGSSCAPSAVQAVTRMLLVSGEYPPTIGGVGDYTFHLAHALARRGHDVSVLISGRAERGRSTCVARGDGVRVHTSRVSWHVANAASMARAIGDLRPDVVNFQYVPQLYGRAGIAPGAAMLPLLIRRMCHATVVSTMHEIASPWDLQPRRLGAAFAHRAQAMLMMTASHRVIVTNPVYARMARRWNGAVHEIPVGPSILPVAVREPEILEIRASLGAGEGALIGEFSPLAVGKSPGDLIALLRTLGTRARLVMLGGLATDAARRGSFMRYAAAAGVAGRIIWTGALSPADISRHLSALDVYVHTHTAGASGRSTTLVSALAHGLPVVAYEGPETGPSMASQGVTLAPRGDACALAGRVAALLDAPEARGRSGAAAHKLHVRQFSWDVIASRVLEAFA